MQDLWILSMLISKKKDLIGVTGSRQHPLVKDIQELTSFKDVLSQDVLYQ